MPGTRRGGRRWGRRGCEGLPDETQQRQQSTSRNAATTAIGPPQRCQGEGPEADRHEGDDNGAIPLGSSVQQQRQGGHSPGERRSGHRRCQRPRRPSLSGCGNTVCRQADMGLTRCWRPHENSAKGWLTIHSRTEFQILNKSFIFP